MQDVCLIPELTTSSFPTRMILTPSALAAWTGELHLRLWEMISAHRIEGYGHHGFL